MNRPKMLSRILLPLVLLCLGLCWFSPAAQAKKKHHGKPGDTADEATPPPDARSLPPEAAPSVDPAAPPSVSLQPFIDRHLGQVLAPLGQPAFTQSELLASLQASYADGMAAAPANHKPAYQAAQSACSVIVGAITERQKAVDALRGSLATHSSEAVQPRGGREAVAGAKNTDAFFVDSQRNNWTQRAGVLRQNITTIYLRERELERQVGAWNPPPPTPAPAPAAPVVPTPAVPAPAAASTATPSVSAPPSAASIGGKTR